MWASSAPDDQQHLPGAPDEVRRASVLGDLFTDLAASQAEKLDVTAGGNPDDVLHRDVDRGQPDDPGGARPGQPLGDRRKQHVWCEKPIGVDREEAKALLADAAAAGLRVGIAPDTVLGPPVQTVRRAIARGDIGQPLSAQTAMQYQGPDAFHPGPEFLFARGGGPVLDMGPYYVTALVNLFGPVARVGAVGLKSRETRAVRVGDREGQAFPVEIPTHVQAIAQFEGGATSQSIFSWDSPLSRLGFFEVIGTEAHHQRARPEPLHRPVAITRQPARENMLAEPVGAGGLDGRRGRGYRGLACSTWPARSAPGCRTSPRRARLPRPRHAHGDEESVGRILHRGREHGGRHPASLRTVTLRGDA